VQCGGFHGLYPSLPFVIGFLSVTEIPPDGSCQQRQGCEDKNDSELPPGSFDRKGQDDDARAAQFESWHLAGGDLLDNLVEVHLLSWSSKTGFKARFDESRSIRRGKISFTPRGEVKWVSRPDRRGEKSARGSYRSALMNLYD
jgi:hypothetical protein